ncbi:hypothetical protein HK104_001349 [Borealophlyctis nickersoniae]|nr:hypothetical protein HK104_001349 [Borealophlyctis nickersoniae]
MADSNSLLIYGVKAAEIMWAWNAEYVIVSGARKREEGYTAEDAGVIALEGEDEKEMLESNAFYKLEHGLEDQQKAVDALPVITRLQRYNDDRWGDPYTMSRIMRKRHREDKKVREAVKKESDAIRDKHNLLLDILPESAEDTEKAKKIKWEPEPETADEKSNRVKMSRVFGRKSASSASQNSPDPKRRLKSIIVSQALAQTDPFAVPDDPRTSPGRIVGTGVAVDLRSMVRKKSEPFERESTVGPDDLGEEFRSTVPFVAEGVVKNGGKSGASLVPAYYGDSDEDVAAMPLVCQDYGDSDDEPDSNRNPG